MFYAFLNVTPTTDLPSHMRFEISYVVIYLSILSPLITFVVNEAVKHEEIKYVFLRLLLLLINDYFRVNLRYQRRARLDFGTKLGMNSPF